MSNDTKSHEHTNKSHEQQSRTHHVCERLTNKPRLCATKVFSSLSVGHQQLGKQKLDKQVRQHGTSVQGALQYLMWGPSAKERDASVGKVLRLSLSLSVSLSLALSGPLSRCSAERSWGRQVMGKGWARDWRIMSLG
jgi:hypothetical protein